MADTQGIDRVDGNARNNPLACDEAVFRFQELHDTPYPIL
jgi:hypothetical protein